MSSNGRLSGMSDGVNTWALTLFSASIPYTGVLYRANVLILAVPLISLLVGKVSREAAFRRLRRARVYALPLVALALLLLLQCFRSPNLDSAIEQCGYWYPGIVLALVCCMMPVSRKRFRLVFGGLMAGAAVFSLHAGIDMVLHGGGFLTGPLLNPNLSGGFLATVLPAGVAWMIYERRPGIRAFLIASVAIVITAAALTRCRGTFLAVLVAFAFLTWVFRAYWLVPAAILHYGLCDMVSPGLMQRVVSAARVEEDYTVGQRFRLWLAGRRLFLSSPLFGHGTDSYRYLAPLQHVADLPMESPELALNCHNSYLQILAEQGLAGFVLFAFPALGSLVSGLRQFLATRDRELAALLASLIAFAAQNMTNSLLLRSYGSLAGWLAFGFVLSYLVESGSVSIGTGAVGPGGPMRGNRRDRA